MQEIERRRKETGWLPAWRDSIDPDELLEALEKAGINTQTDFVNASNAQLLAVVMNFKKIKELEAAE